MQVGVFGQGFHAVKLILWSLVVVVPAGCAEPDGTRFVGMVTTSQGSCGLGFVDGKATATLMVRGADVAFAPSDGVTVLPGHVTGEHVVAGSSSVGADKKPFVQVFEGDRKGDEVSGVFATPRCRAAVALRRG